MLYQTKNPHGGDVYGDRIDFDFSSNTNPFGTPKGVRQAIQAAANEVEHYPDPYCRDLVRAISEAEQVPSEYILCGNGAAELIYSYCEALKPKTAMELAPTFSEYSLGLERVGCKVLRYALQEKQKFSLDSAILAALDKLQPNALFLCNPNNPTGMTIPQPLLHEIVQTCQELNIHLFLDECFLDLADRGDTMKPLLAACPNLFILKAFTKNYGMAGVRLGYCLCADQSLLSRMAQTVQPWNISLLAQAAGVSALQEQDFLARTTAFIPKERQWLKDQLETLGLYVSESHANYLLLRGPENLEAALRTEHIAIRNCDNYHGLGAGWFRVAVRLRTENEALLQAIARTMGKEISWQRKS